MEIGTIKAVRLYLHERLHVTAELELNVKGINYIFGGHPIFVSGKNGGAPCDAPYLGRFLFRCMQICDIESWEQLKSNKVLVDISQGNVVAIGNVTGNRWFNPQAEFEAMEHERDSNTFYPGFKSYR
jgi:hypothetical protein